MARYLGSRATVWRAALICAGLAALLPAQDKAVFEGKVVDSVTGTGVARAAIHLAPLKEGPGYSGRADADGRFRFEAIEPGDYHLEVSARGYSDATAAVLEAGRATALLHFEARQSVTAASIPVAPEAVLTGRITDEPGEALPGAAVQAYQETWQNGIRTFHPIGRAEADDRGEYRLRLSPGRYYLTAVHPAPARTFTADPGKPEMRIASGATDSPVVLRAGQQMGGYDFKLAAVVAYHVRGALAPWRGSSLNLPLYLIRQDGLGMSAGGVIEKDGSFDIRGVTPGRYWLQLPPYRGVAIAANFSLEVTDRDVNGVKIVTMTHFAVRGRARFEESDVASPLSSVKFDLLELDRNLFQMSPRVAPDRDGEFVVNGMQCAEYVPRIVSEGDYYLKSVLIAGRPVEASRIDLRNGAAGEIEMVLGTGTGELSGAVRWPDPLAGQPPANLEAAWAILVSADGPTSDTGARSVEIDPYGQFRFRFVPPGRWLVFVAPEFDSGLWQNAGFVKQIAGGGTLIDLDKKATVRVEASPLTAEDVERAIDKVRQ